MVPMVPVLRYCGGGGEDYNFLFHFLLPGRVIVTFVINSIILILLIPTPCALCTLNVLPLLLLLPVIDFFSNSLLILPLLARDLSTHDDSSFTRCCTAIGILSAMARPTSRIGAPCVSVSHLV